MVEILIKSDKVIISILGLHKLLACKSQIELTRKNIKSVKHLDRYLKPPFWRIPGTYIPWVIIAGTYYGRKRKEFWDVIPNSGKGIVIDLENDKYTKVVVDIENPVVTIKEIQTNSADVQ
ncbi:MAG: hypothetical protein AABY84_09005 [Candidatus Firestonebacteria bacterium]